MIKILKSFSSWEQCLLTACYLEKYIQDTQKDDVRLSESVFSNSCERLHSKGQVCERNNEENSTWCHVSFFFFPLMVQAEHWSFATYFLKSVWNINLPDWMFHILPWENVSKILAMSSGLPRSSELDWGRMRQAGRYRAADQQRSTDSTSTGSLGRVPALEHRESHVSQCLF